MSQHSREEALRSQPPKALLFDVFGTVVDWRTTVTSTLISRAAEKLESLDGLSSGSSSSTASLSPATREKLSSMKDSDWSTFAQEWRNSYKTFTKSFNPETDEWMDIDTHHHLSLISLLQQYSVSDLYSESEILDLSRVWHFLAPWSDSSAGIARLNGSFETSTLSNGNRELLGDLQEFGNLGFKSLQSSADFGAYKPHERTYRGAVEKLGWQMGECAMVAAHLSDLEAARKNGMKTIYVERKGEEDWDRGGEKWEAARGWVDLWVSLGEGEGEEGGLVEVARRLSCS